MAHPFPGMNPWLESSVVWRSVHQRLITALADGLAPQLEPRYFVDQHLSWTKWMLPGLPNVWQKRKSLSSSEKLISVLKEYFYERKNL